MSLTTMECDNCHVRSHSYLTCHLAEVTFTHLPQPMKAGIRFTDPTGMQG